MVLGCNRYRLLPPVTGDVRGSETRVLGVGVWGCWGASNSGLKALGYGFEGARVVVCCCRDVIVVVKLYIVVCCCDGVVVMSNLCIVSVL